MKVKVFCSPHWLELQGKALSIWHWAQDKGLSPLLIVPTTNMRSHWLSVLAEELKGVSGESVSVLDLLAYRLASLCAGKLVRLSQPLEQKLAAIIALSRLNLPRDWERVGIIDAFLSTVEELELHDLSPDEVQTPFPNDETILILTQWWREWKEVLHGQGLWSLSDALKAAIECLREGKVNPPKAQRVFLYGFTALPPTRWEFLKELLKSMDSGDLTVFFFKLVNIENEKAYGYAMPLLNRLKSEFNAEVCCLQSNLPNEIKLLPELLFRRYKPKGKLQPTDRIVYVAAAGEEQELEMAVRLLVHWRRSGQLSRLSDALIVAQSLEPYLLALEAISARYGVPFSIAGKPVRTHKGLTNLLWAIWNARKSDWGSEYLWSVLPSPHLCCPDEPHEPLIPKDKHRDLLAFIRQRLAERGSARWVELLRSNFGNDPFVKAISFFFKVVDDLPTKAPAKDHARLWTKVLQFVRPINQRDEKTLQNLRGQLNVLKTWSATVSGDEFIELLTEACVEDVKEFRDAVRVASASEARGLVSGVVILLGMVDGRFPPLPPMFELLTDRHREVLTNSLNLTTSLRFRRRPKKIEFATSFAQEQRMLLAEILGIATERLTFCHPRTDHEGRPIARSLFLDEIEDVLKVAGYFGMKEERDLADVVLPKQETENPLLPTGTEQAINTHEAKVAAMFYAFTGRGSLTGTEEALVSTTLRDENLRERLNAEWLRWTRPQEGAWDGKSLKVPVQALLARWKEKGLWVTALEDYGHCPYRFFARYELNLRRPYEIAFTVDPSTVGELWHRIVAEFLKVFQRKGTFPSDQELRQVAKSVFDNHPRVKQMPKQVQKLLWEQIEVTLPSVWKAEQIQATQWMPIRIEDEISLPASALGNIPQDWCNVNLVLRPDRIDHNKKLKDEHRIVDYKTLRNPPSQKHIQNGIAFQLPLYAFALKQEGACVSEALFLKLLSFTSRGDYREGCRLGGKEVRGNQPLTLLKAIFVAKEHACRYLRQIAQADFTILPFSLNESCRTCDFKALCRHHPLRLKERITEAEVGDGV